MWFCPLLYGISLVGSATQPFLTTWRTTSPNETITLPLASLVLNLTIQWGDGTQTDTFINSAFPIMHNYSSAGLHNVSILGDLTGFRFEFGGDSTKLIEIKSWGDGFLVDSNSIYMFANCTNLQVTASNQPTFLPGATLYGMFYLSGVSFTLIWDIQNVVSLAYMFADTPNMNMPLTFSNSLGVTDVMGMFRGAARFNQMINLDTSSVTNMVFMFMGATNYNLPLNINTGNVISMQSMFQNAASFNQPVNFDTKKVTTMQSMFAGATAFNQPVNFNTLNVQNMSAMFYNATNFNQPINFDTNKVIFFTAMFSSATKFNRGVTLNTSKAINMDAMFANASAFDQPLSFDTANVQSMSAMFSGASIFNQALSFNTMNVVLMNSMFESAAKFNQQLNFNTSKVTNMQWMFSNAISFNQTLNFDTRKVATMSGMFYNARSFDRAVNFDTSNVASIDSMFNSAINFNKPVNFNTGNVTTMMFMFFNAVSFNQPVLFNTSRVTLMSGMFSNARKFNQSVNFDTAKVTSMDSMFANAVSFNKPVNFDTGSALVMPFMFYNAVEFNQPLNFTNTSGVTTMQSMFESAVAFNQPINLQGDNLAAASSMFKNAASFNRSVTLSNTNRLRTVSYMFANVSDCFNQTVNFSSTSSMEDMRGMFTGAVGFEQDLSNWASGTVTACFNFCPRCSLPRFPSCSPCGGSPRLSVNNVSVCTLPTNGTCGVLIFPTVDPLCKLAQVVAGLQIECIPTPAPSGTPSVVVISPLFNITHDDFEPNKTNFVFTLPIDPQVYRDVGTISQACSSFELSCEWQDPETMEFRQSGCAVSRKNVDMGSGVVGTECSCTHLTVFAIALRSEMRLAPLCQAQQVDYALIILYVLLAVCLMLQLVRLLRFQLYRESSASLTQHSVLLFACVLRVVYLIAKPVIKSLAALVLLGLLPSAVALSLFIHLLLTWTGLKLTTSDADRKSVV